MRALWLLLLKVWASQRLQNTLHITSCSWSLHANQRRLRLSQMQIIVRQAMCIDWPLIANSDDQMQCFDLTFILFIQIIILQVRVPWHIAWSSSRFNFLASCSFGGLLQPSPAWCGHREQGRTCVNHKSVYIGIVVIYRAFYPNLPTWHHILCTDRCWQHRPWRTCGWRSWHLCRIASMTCECLGCGGNMHRKAGLSSRLVFISVLLVRWGWWRMVETSRHSLRSFEKVIFKTGHVVKAVVGDRYL